VTFDPLHFVRLHCVTSPGILLGIIAYHFWTGVSYFRIPVTMWWIMRRAGGPPRITRGAMRGTIVFIFLCGTLHWMIAVTLFFPWLDIPTLSVGFATMVSSHWTADRLRMVRAEIVRWVVDGRELDAKLNPT
jgi:hypothetical protein